MTDAIPSRAATPYLDDGDVQLYHGDVIDVLAQLPAGIAQTCITSPPYWGLRSYLPDGHDDKTAELGLEATPELYVERLVAVFREVWRVLRDDGTVWLNLGDSYASGNGGDTRSSGFNERYFGKPSIEDKQGATNAQLPAMQRPPGLKPKDLVGIPWRVAFALQADGWTLRSDIIWAKPNPMPESVSDRPTKAHEYLFLLTKQPRYFYDADAIREPNDAVHMRWTKTKRKTVGGEGEPGVYQGAFNRAIANGSEAVGRNRRSVWTIPTEPFPEAHFATFPKALVRPCILAGTSERGECVACGAPWVRVVERVGGTWDERKANGAPMRYGLESPKGTPANRMGDLSSETTGWRASCTCAHGIGRPPGTGTDGNQPRTPQTVLDPFIGSGTTALVARNHGRRCIGIDLSAEYLAIAARRLQQLSLFADSPGRSGDTLEPECA
jgi:DNA modification methylase